MDEINSVHSHFMTSILSATHLFQIIAFIHVLFFVELQFFE